MYRVAVSSFLLSYFLVTGSYQVYHSVMIRYRAHINIQAKIRDIIAFRAMPLAKRSATIVSIEAGMSQTTAMYIMLFHALPTDIFQSVLEAISRLREQRH